LPQPARDDRRGGIGAERPQLRQRAAQRVGICAADER